MKMKRKSARRIPALLLTLVMLLSLMPTALAAANNVVCTYKDCPSNVTGAAAPVITNKEISRATCFITVSYTHLRAHETGA